MASISRLDFSRVTPKSAPLHGSQPHAAPAASLAGSSVNAAPLLAQHDRRSGSSGMPCRCALRPLRSWRKCMRNRCFAGVVVALGLAYFVMTVITYQPILAAISTGSDALIFWAALIVGLVSFWFPALLAWQSWRCPGGGIEVRQVGSGQETCQLPFTLRLCAFVAVANPALRMGFAIYQLIYANTFAETRLKVLVAQVVAVIPPLTMSAATFQLGFVTRCSHAFRAVVAAEREWAAELQHAAHPSSPTAHASAMRPSTQPFVDAFDEAAAEFAALNSEYSLSLFIVVLAHSTLVIVHSIAFLLIPVPPHAVLVVGWVEVTCVAIGLASLLVAAAFVGDRHRRLSRLVACAAFPDAPPALRGSLDTRTVQRRAKDDEAAVVETEAAKLTRELHFMACKASLQSHVQWHRSKLTVRVGSLGVTRAYVQRLGLALVTSLVAMLAKDVVLARIHAH